MNRRTARAVREAVIIARNDHFLLKLVLLTFGKRAHECDLRELLKSGGPSSTIGGNAYAVALTRLTRKATP